MKYALAALVLLAAIAVADDRPARSGHYDSSMYRFSIDSPGFEKIGDEQETDVLQFFAPASPSTTVNVHVAVHPGHTIERTREIARMQLDRRGFHLKEEKKLQVSGRDATLFEGEGPYKGTPTTVLELVVLDAPTTYRVTALAKTEDFPKVERALRAAVESFKVEAKK